MTKQILGKNEVHGKITELLIVSQVEDGVSITIRPSEKVMSMIEEGEMFTVGETRVNIVTESDNRYLRSIGNSSQADNLDNVPTIADAMPQLMQFINELLA